ncbi:Hypothetical protein FKW44_019566 [Caligus rogercresseyi]|uniref:Uncharacterized protein n=1 Tax=Caligus rogercresseyi TaxID=217165 RepID=A0A7T8GW20_CALRO|nr:Hypothetical protein FKW44_019566 [Caligus rogercresseyi]
MEGLQLMELVEKSTSKLRLPLLKAFILFLSNGFTLSKFQEPEGDLLKALLVLLPSWAAADDSEALICA